MKLTVDKNQVYRNQQHRNYTHYDFGGELLSNHSTNFWRWLANRDSFVSELRAKGYYQVNRHEIKDQYNQQSLSKNIQQPWGERRIPSFFIDRFESIPPILAKNDLFLVPTGRYGCVIFDRRVFPDTYIHMNKCRSNIQVTKLHVRNKTNLRAKMMAINNPFTIFDHSRWNEQSFIRFLHYSGIFSELVRIVCHIRSGEYVLGPVGHTKISFPFWMRDRKGCLIPFTFNGMSDLDECIFVRDCNTVIVIEAKLNAHEYDLAWYKLAFPAYRFIANKFPWSSLSKRKLSENKQYFKIIPVYAAYDNPDSTLAHLYVLPKLLIHRGKAGCVSELSNGIILNDERQFTPEKIYELDLSK